MADIQQKTTSTTQFIVSSLRKILGPFALPGQKAIRDEYLKSLGLDPQDKPDPETGKIDAFLAKKAEEADEQSFNEAMAQINTIIVSIEDIIQSAVNASSFTQGAKDIVTALLNMLTIDFMRQNHPILHNVFFMLQTTHSFSNRSDSKTELSMFGAYFRDFFKSYNQETSEEARRLSEGLGFLTSIFSFMNPSFSARNMANNRCDGVLDKFSDQSKYCSYLLLSVIARDEAISTFFFTTLVSIVAFR